LRGPKTRLPLRRVWLDIRPRNGRGLLSVLLASLAVGCAIGLIATSGWLISSAALQPPMVALAIAVVCVRAFGIGRGTFRYAERLVSHSAALRGLTGLRVKVVDRLAVIAPVGLQSLRGGDALRRVVDDVDVTADLGLRVLLPGSTAVLVGGLLVAFASWLLPAAGIALLIGLLIGGIVAPWVARTSGVRAARLESGLKGELAASVSNQLHDCADLSAANATERRLQRVIDLDTQVTDIERRMASSLGLATAIGVGAQAIALLGIILVAVPAVSSGALQGVNLAVVVLIPLVAFELIAGLPVAALALARASAAANRVVDLIDRPDPVPDPVNPEALPPGEATLRAQDVNVTWPGADRPAVTGVDLHLYPGRKIALIGPSGSGKSSLAAAFVRFVPYSGSITLNGVELSDLRGDDVRSVIGLCSQDAHIFDNSIAENVRLARTDATDDQILRALNAVGLKEFLSSLPRGIHTAVGEHGAQLSGGQRRRIALARNVLTDTPIVILDEPTEHLDALSAESIVREMLEATAASALLWITHDLRHLDEFDEVLLLSEGKILA